MKPLSKTYKPGTHLFHENDRSRELYLIQAGNVKVYRKINGHEVELAVLGKGAVLGEMALIDGKPRSASAKTIDECCVILIDADTFHAKIKGVPAWFLSIVRMTSQKIRQANRRLQIINNENQGAGIVVMLYYQFKRYGEEKPLDLQKTRQQIISLLGTTHQRVVKVLELLDKNKFIELNENTISLIDGRRLREFTSFLRMDIRKAFEKMAPLSKDVKLLIRETIRQYPDLMNDESEGLDMTGEQFWSILFDQGFSERHEEIVSILKEEGFLTVQKKEGAEKGDNPYAGAAIQPIRDIWTRSYLHINYNDMGSSL